MKKTDPHLSILEAAYKKAAAAAKKHAGHKEIKDLDAAKAAIDAHKKRRAEEAGDSTAPLKTLTGDVLAYLKAQGWKIEKSKLSADKRFIRCGKDGTYTREAADEYARVAGLQRLDGADPGLQSLAEQKLRAETRLAEERAEKIKLENEIEQKKWTRTSKIEGMLASRGALLKNGVGPEFIHARASAIIERVEGNQDRAPELVAFWLAEIDELFDRYAAPVEFAGAAAQEADD